MALAKLEIDAQEAMALLQLVRTRVTDLERIVQNIEEGEGMDLQRHNALKSTRPQIEMLEVLSLKLTGALNDLSRKQA